MGLEVTKQILRGNRRLCIYHTKFDPEKKTLLFILNVKLMVPYWKFHIPFLFPKLVT